MDTLKVGNKLLCTYGTDFPDNTTTGKIYEVSEVYGPWFRITNDQGLECLPLLSKFNRKWVY